MTNTQKKIGYGLLSLASLGVFVVVLARATYDTSFLTFGHDDDSAPSLRATEALATTVPGSAPRTSNSTTSTTAIHSAPAPKPAPAVAVHGMLAIPSIGVNAAIENVGLTSAGNMATPKKLADVGWYKYGTAPGDVGSAVLAGHVENSLGFPGVFHELAKVQVGDDVYVTAEDGTRLHFVVTNVADYAVSDAPTDKIFNDTSGKRILNLITCRKTIIGGKAHYDNRTVVTAVRA